MHLLRFFPPSFFCLFDTPRTSLLSSSLSFLTLLLQQALLLFPRRFIHFIPQLCFSLEAFNQQLPETVSFTTTAGVAVTNGHKRPGATDRTTQQTRRRTETHPLDSPKAPKYYSLSAYDAVNGPRSRNNLRIDIGVECDTILVDNCRWFSSLSFARKQGPVL
jgi:hypothetical protein